MLQWKYSVPSPLKYKEQVPQDCGKAARAHKSFNRLHLVSFPLYFSSYHPRAVLLVRAFAISQESS
jgi:hypothetical protein